MLSRASRCLESGQKEKWHIWRRAVAKFTEIMRPGFLAAGFRYGSNTS